MNFNKNRMVPGFISRVTSVWYRHVRVYMSSFSAMHSSFFEPLIFLAGLGIGIGSYIDNMGGMSYPLFLASGLIVTSSMHTAAFECTFGTFIRLEFDKVYDGMLGAPISVRDLVIGEILFAGTKGAFFAFAVLIVTWIFGIIREPMSIFTIVIGFITGILFAAISMYITSFVRNINHFNFYLTGVISPMFFFSGVVFPVENLPSSIRWVTEFMPLTHVVKMARAFCVTELLSWALLYNLLIVLLFIVVTGGLAIKGLKKRLII